MKLDLKELLYSILSGFFSLSFSFHQLYPSFQAFLQSSRTSTEIKYSDFSNFPGLELTNVFPFTLGYYQNFKGSEISGALSYVETYNYIGIVAFFLLIFYFLYGSSDSNYKFVRNLIVVYLILSFKDFFPVLGSIDIPLYDNFRYWNRSIILVIVAVVFALNHIFSKNFNFSKSNFKFITFLCLFYSITYFLSFFISLDKPTLDFWNFLISSNLVYLRKIEILVWICLIFSVFILMFFVRTKKFYLFTVVLVIIIFLDYFYFSLDLLPNRISRFNSFKSVSTPEVCLNKRCFLENKSINGYEFLMYKTFGPNGYSQFISQSYKDFYLETFKGDYRKSIRSEFLRSNLNTSTLKNLGFSYILLTDGNKVSIDASSSFLNHEIKPKFLKEGKYSFDIDSPEPRYLSLNLKYSPNWEVFINGKKSMIEPDQLFSKILLNKGANYIEIYYFPSDVLFGLLIGLIMFLVTIGFYFLTLFFKFSKK